MTEYTVTNVATHPDGRIRVFHTAEDGALTTTTFRPEAITCRAAEYGVDDPRDALDLILHEPYQPNEWDDPRDDPATAAGWVTDTTPDSVPIALWTARSTDDARGAHLARIKGTGSTVADPDGHLDTLAAGLAVDPDLYRRHRERVDMTRWTLIYGGFPAEIEGDAHA